MEEQPYTFGHSVILQHGEPDGEPNIKIARVVSIDPPPLDAEETEVSHMESEEQWKEWAATWADIGELSVTIQYSASRKTELLGLFRQMRSWRIQYVDGSALKFKGFIKSLPQEVNREGTIEQTVTIRGSGMPEFSEVG